MTLHEIVRKLTGPIKPVGETNKDNRRYENLKIFTTLVEALILDLRDVADMQHYDEYSIKRAGEYADNFLANELDLG